MKGEGGIFVGYRKVFLHHPKGKEEVFGVHAKMVQIQPKHFFFFFATSVESNCT